MREEAAHELHPRLRKDEPLGDGAGVFGENGRASLHGDQHLGFAVFGGVKDGGREPGHGHLVGLHGPAHEVGEAVQAERAQDLLGQRSDLLVQVIVREHQPQPLHGQIVSAAAIAQELAPTSGLLHRAFLAPMHRRAGARDDRDPVLIAKRGGHPGIAIAPQRELRVRPRLLQQPEQPRAIFFRAASRQKRAHMRDLPRQHRKKEREGVIADQPQIGEPGSTPWLSTARSASPESSTHSVLVPPRFDSEDAIHRGNIARNWANSQLRIAAGRGGVRSRCLDNLLARPATPRRIAPEWLRTCHASGAMPNLAFGLPKKKAEQFCNLLLTHPFFLHKRCNERINSCVGAGTPSGLLSLVLFLGFMWMLASLRGAAATSGTGSSDSGDVITTTSPSSTSGQGNIAGRLSTIPGLPPNLSSVAKALDNAASDPRAAKIFSVLNNDNLGKLVSDVDHINPDKLTSA